MSVKLRLRRGGRKKHPVYRIVAIDSRKRRDGEYIEKVGFYDPNPDPAIIEVDREKAIKWLNDGAIPSDTVKSFLQKDGIMHEFSLRKRGLDDDQITEELKKWEILQLEKQKKVEAKAAMAKRDEQAKKEAEKEGPVATVAVEETAADAVVEDTPQAEAKSEVEEVPVVAEEEPKTDKAVGEAPVATEDKTETEVPSEEATEEIKEKE